MTPPVARRGHPPRPRGPRDWRTWIVDRAPFLVACLMLIALLGVYSTLQRDVFSLEELNLDATAAMALLLAATGQTIVLLRGGIDLSIGGMISLRHRSRRHPVRRRHVDRIDLGAS